MLISFGPQNAEFTLKKSRRFSIFLRHFSFLSNSRFLVLGPKTPNSRLKKFTAIAEWGVHVTCSHRTFFSYHRVFLTPTFGCRPQHKAYSCRRILEWKRKRTFNERIHISFLTPMHIHLSDPFREIVSEACTNVFCLFDKTAALAAYLN